MNPFRFPDDLVALQTSWLLTYDALAQTPANVGTTALRQRLIVLSLRLHTHPFWASSGRRPASGFELRHQARERTRAAAA
ncbi:hypothetical protein ACFXD5_38550 [Streptomyces sp. NPDC059385]|uniref:hypothetical protein n=1 Tax=Streptomyces sp. NPDC059385 TaxID=3346817 RepID=UPI0036B90386